MSAGSPVRGWLNRAIDSQMAGQVAGKAHPPSVSDIMPRSLRSPIIHFPGANVKTGDCSTRRRGPLRMNKQLQYTTSEAIDANAIDYIDELVAVGELPQRFKVNRCSDCEEKGMVRAAIFGEDFCANCWRGRW